MKLGDKNYILILLRLINTILNMPAKEEIDKVRTSLSSISTTFRGNMNILLYIDRLKELLKQKIEDKAYSKKIYEIESCIGSSIESSSVFTGSNNFADYGCFSPALNILEHYNEEELKKYFYSLCLSLKVKFHNTNIKNMISTDKLYQEAISKNISPDQ